MLKILNMIKVFWVLNPLPPATKKGVKTQKTFNISNMFNISPVGSIVVGMPHNYFDIFNASPAGNIKKKSPPKGGGQDPKQFNFFKTFLTFPQF